LFFDLSDERKRVQRKIYCPRGQEQEEESEKKQLDEEV
jgi:hypothetical protein